MLKLKTENITKSFDDRIIIEDINIELKKGEIVSLIGVSGSGKTTLFNILSGLTKPDKGRVYLDGEDITTKPGKISYMLQKDLLLPHKKIIDNAALGLVVKGMKKKEARKEAEKYFEAFGLTGTKDKYPSQLSGGMRQRVALLRTYLATDGVALLDEPFSALDAITKSGMHNWYLDLMSKIEMSTIFITHDIEEAILLSDRIYILAGTPGTIVKEIVIDKATKEEHFLEYKERIKKMLI
ncbi:MAG: ABC transporter ATP-binding protein [Lachnospira sp.]|nr:ABC transporter ATP-binding protein [Lachnospira sp.]